MSEHSKPRKLKIVLLGNRAVGKSSIIRRYILDEFSPNVQVNLYLFSQLSESITCRKWLHWVENNIGWNFGIQLVKRNIVPWLKDI